MNWYKKYAQTQETIVGSAVKLSDGRVYSVPKPGRHGHVFVMFKEMRERGDGVPKEGQIQGFVTNTGRFVDRKEGAELALSNGQIKKLNWPPDLYSEDLW